MSDTVISVDKLGKMYRIRGNRRSEGLRHALENGVKRLGRRIAGKAELKPYFEDFWALEDVSFEVKRGECVGIIGRNGAGKSTLLKILSRITEPTTGEIRMKGRVGSLLEVGTGFHPELTGRENIFLNGAILGMGRTEIKRKFDEIVAFSEVEKFLDTPVKYYSSGMYTRLAFSVAAHLEPEILIVDEVLAVGDAEFQKKCLGKMGEVATGGRTILFVSHNMAAVEQLCHGGILLQDGRVDLVGPARECIGRYATGWSLGGGRIIDHTTKRTDSVTVQSLRVNGSESDEVHLPPGTQELTLEMAGIVHQPTRGDLQARLQDSIGTPLGIFSPAFERGEADRLPVGPFYLKHTMRLPRLNRGEYVLMFELVQPNLTAWYEARDACHLHAAGTPMATGQTFDVSERLGWLLLEEVKA